MKDKLETKRIEEKWFWMMDYCKRKEMPPAQTWAWEEAELEYNKHIHNKMFSVNEKTALIFKLKLNVDEWGKYKKGDVDEFHINLLDEQNGLVRHPIDKRWDVISCKII